MSVENGSEIQPRHPEIQPIVDAGAFTILAAVKKPGESLHVVTDQSLRRRDFPSPFPLNETQTEVLKNAMKGEIGFVQKRKVPALLKSEGREGEAVTTRDYARSMSPKVGIRNIRQENETLRIDIRPVTFPVYSELVNRGEEEKGLLDFGEATGTAAAIFTRDGKLIVQFRGKNNRVYGNIPGASAAGMLDGQFDETIDPNGKRHGTGTLKPIDDVFITSNLTKEAEEELKVKKDDLDTKIVGIAHDEIKPHHEFMLAATIDKTAEELAEEGLIPDEEGGHDFKERYFTIDGTPEAINTLLARVRCPLPTTHAAVFLMAGYEKMLERNGFEAADEWLKITAEGIKHNYEEIDRIVQMQYEQFPDQIEGKPRRSKVGYDANYPPEQQGLPSLLDELKRTELITPELHIVMKKKYGE